MRRPAPLLNPLTARLIGFALLAGLGALEWRRMVESLSPGRALLWVLVGVAVAVALRPAGRRGAVATAAVATAGLLAAIAASGLDLGLLRPARWAELAEGLWRGIEALGGVRLPYQGVDPWPGDTLALAGALLVLGAALLAFWPRGDGRGWRGSALVLLLVLIASPVAAMSIPAPLILGAATAAATAAFLFLERLPVRPGAGVVVLAAAALAAALPLGAAADRDEPWFDYRSFAEGLGPVEPIRFAWEHSYGPIDWPRDGRELFRVRSAAPFYWKAESLTGFDGERWTAARRGDPDGDLPAADLAPAAAARPAWEERVEVTLTRLRTDALVGPGTILGLAEAGRGVAADWIPSRWITSRELGRGDSYAVRAHVPQPSRSRLAAATAGWSGQQADALELRLDLREDARAGTPQLPRPPGVPPRYAEEVLVEFAPFGLARRPVGRYELAGVRRDGGDALRRTHYRRTWRLARRLRDASESAWDYVLRVNAHLRSQGFRYTERPPAPAPGVPPLESFLHDTRAGYCQQFSGAMALLLRMGGVPARVGAGFTPGGYRKRRAEWVVRDVDAHSWVEVWFDDIGWVTFDPTPSATPARSQTAALELPSEPAAAGPDAGDEGGSADAPARRPEGATREPGASSSPGPTGSGGPPWSLVALLTAAGVALAAFAARRAGAPADPLAELERALRRSGRPAPASTTLAELERGLGGSAYLRALRAARYGTGVPPTAAERAAFRRELAAGLGWSGRLRALWALPPRPPRLRLRDPR